MIVRDIMSENVVWVTPNTSLVEVARLMQKEDIGSVPVYEQNRLQGIITDRDMILRAIATGKNPNSLQANDIMSRNVVTVSPDTDVHEASEIMAGKQIRRLPVMENNKLVGIIALGDLAVERIHVDEAGEALSDISQGIHH
ncbi:MAG: CBS domain-containing protein [Desulfitobacteriaceae bacterium]|nr:CBS domain-containing protein [Desulfitobacteriaceae bacterium]MDD4346229.1 CBS domain-containing protein [Desulfitobacteriaceae bacterium]MDD4401638.1 CBS domain-containing protein [Desulfitobacteriaceae bacterium]